jgi:diaminopimelate decarboxylase
LIAEFVTRTGRGLEFEIEPGTFLTANCGVLVTTVQDITSTGERGYTFLKIDSGMTEVSGGIYIMEGAKLHGGY